MQRVMEISALTLQKSGDKQIEIHAEGKVPTSGWRNPVLTPWRYITPPKDGIQDFDFQADEPAGVSLQVISTVTATLTTELDIENFWGAGNALKGVRVHARADSREAGFTLDLVDGDRWVPWPWKFQDAGSSTGQTSDMPISGLIGHHVRIYREGDALTLDYSPDRVNIALRRDEPVIAHISFG